MTTREKYGIKLLRSGLYLKKNRARTCLAKNWPSTRLWPSLWLIFLRNEASCEKNLFYVFCFISRVEQPAIDYLRLSSAEIIVFKHTGISNSIFSKMYHLYEHISLYIFDLFFHLDSPPFGLYHQFSYTLNNSVSEISTCDDKYYFPCTWLYPRYKWNELEN